MPITLTSRQEEWIVAHVESGEFASIEDGVRRLLDERIAELAIERDDLGWAEPLVREALAERSRGAVISLEDHEARNEARLSPEA